MCKRDAVDTLARIPDWPHLWDVVTAAIAMGAFALSWQNSRRIAKADTRVHWRLDIGSDSSVYVRNDGPADALDVRIEFVEGTPPLSRGQLEHPVVHAGSKVWVARFAPQSNYMPRDRFRVTWRGGPPGGWSTQV